MNAQAILDKIECDSRDAAAAILANANDQAVQMKKQTEAKIDALREKTKADALKEAVAAQARMERMAELDERKLLLETKRQVIDQAFAAALEKLKSMPAEKAQAYLMNQLLSAAKGDETLIIGSDHDAWFTPDFLSKANEALQKAGKLSKLTLSDEKRPGVCGLILSANDVEINCTFEALLEAQRLDMEAEVAEILF